MIPKKIHYCWFGGNPLPELAVKCMASWSKFCPDYEIIAWNEHNFDVTCCDYVREAAEAKKWAFVSDYARLYALLAYGGVYMDTDVEVTRPLDEFLSLKAFSGFQTKDTIPTGIMACEKGFPLFEAFLHDYDNRHFLRSDGSYDTTTNVVRMTNICLKEGLVLNNALQTIRGFTLYPKDWFCAKNHVTGLIELTENTHSIHHFNGSWLSDEELKWKRMRDAFCRKYGKMGYALYLCFKYALRVKSRFAHALWKKE